MKPRKTKNVFQFLSSFAIFIWAFYFNITANRMLLSNISCCFISILTLDPVSILIPSQMELEIFFSLCHIFQKWKKIQVQSSVNNRKFSDFCTRKSKLSHTYTKVTPLEFVLIIFWLILLKVNSKFRRFISIMQKYNLSKMEENRFAVLI